ncbi:MerR family transcriptional regulator [Pseudooceanicola algae]|uniref:HTH merR-type domain-containing protein n=1 Tax=Pseudooceanicola algae TaxID=1537215 RepID=A0A418SH30_9RHOB|nr:MerR family DNA-binding transcriptional regulator [Pseudooceanicola algae]QPM90360.1 hypothetical protein PSAL_015980 [Pseudooceanicola algae]
MTEKPLSFREMCEKFEVTPRTLRYYEYIELLGPDREGRARWYGSREVARMTLIMRGRRFGFSLEAIRQWLEMREQQGSEAQMHLWIEMADQQMSELAEQRRHIDEAMEELQRLRDSTKAELGVD